MQAPTKACMHTYRGASKGISIKYYTRQLWTSIVNNIKITIFKHFNTSKLTHNHSSFFLLLLLFFIFFLTSCSFLSNRRNNHLHVVVFYRFLSFHQQKQTLACVFFTGSFLSTSRNKHLHVWFLQVPFFSPAETITCICLFYSQLVHTYVNFILNSSLCH